MVTVRTGVIAAIVLYAAQASAQPAPDPKAAELFVRGRDQLKRGETEAACGSFAESFAIEQADGTELNLADCQERLGHLADAWRLFEQTATLSAGKGNDVRAAAARDRAAALLPKLGQIAVTIEQPGDAGITVTIAGASVPPSGLIQRKADPGAIAIRVTRPGHAIFEQAFSVQAGEVREVFVPVDVPAPTGLESHRTNDLAPTVMVDGPKVTSRHRQHSRVVLAEVLGGSGVALVGAGVVIGVIANSHYKSQFSNGGCVKMGNAIECTPTGTQRANAAVSLGDTATVIGGIGLAAAIAGGVVWFTAPVEVSVTPTSASVALRGTF